MYFRLLLAICCVMFSMVVTATGADTAAKAPVLPIVDVVTMDGKTVHGRLTTADAAEVTIQPLTAGQDAQTIAWRNVRRVSNGLTQAKAAETWKTLHKDDLCATCKGDRLVVCATCKGTGHDLASRTDCKTCKGAGVAACSGPHCEKGQIPCPGPCLKLSVGTWTMQDGKRVRTFPTANGGTYWVSELHQGQVVEMKNGLATGKTTICPVCNGKATTDCSVCHGTGQEPCKECSKATTPACPDHCDHGMAKCGMRGNRS